MIVQLNLGNAYGNLGEAEPALALLEECASWWQQAGDQLFSLQAVVFAQQICWQSGRYRAYGDYAAKIIPWCVQVGRHEFAAQLQVRRLMLDILRGDFALAAARLEVPARVLDGANDIIYDYQDKVGLLLTLSGDYVRARDILQAGYARYQAIIPRLDSIRELCFRLGLCVALYGSGDHPSARATLIEAMARAISHNERGNILIYLPVAALLLAAAGRYEIAAPLLALATARLGEWSGWLHHWELFAALRTELEGALGPTTFHEAWQRGESQSVSEAARLAQATLQAV